MFPVNGSLHMAPRFPRSGPGKSGSPMSQVLLRCYDFPPRISGRLFASLPGSTRSSSLRVSQLALPVGRRGLPGPGHCSTGDPNCRCARTWTCGDRMQFDQLKRREFIALLCDLECGLSPFCDRLYPAEACRFDPGVLARLHSCRDPCECRVGRCFCL